MSGDLSSVFTYIVMNRLYSSLVSVPSWVVCDHYQWLVMCQLYSSSMSGYLSGVFIISVWLCAVWQWMHYRRYCNVYSSPMDSPEYIHRQCLTVVTHTRADQTDQLDNVGVRGPVTMTKRIARSLYNSHGALEFFQSIRITNKQKLTDSRICWGIIYVKWRTWCWPLLSYL